jgi:hypothetical protein
MDVHFKAVSFFDFFATTGTTTAFFVDIGFFLLEAWAVFAGWKVEGEGGLLGFVTFPSDARSSRRKIGFSFYSDLSRFGGSVAPVRRREDTEGDRDSGVKVQLGWLGGVTSRMPFEPL